MIKIKQAVIVEGKYDKIKLSSILDTLIIETDGFKIFKDKEKQKLIRKLAETYGIVVLTDSDSAGFKIRSFIGGTVQNENIINAYIPDILGKEKRKTESSKEGKLGVEGVSADIIIEALTRAGINFEEINEKRKLINKNDLYEDGVTGQKNSKLMKAALLEYLDLPERLSTNALMKLLNMFISFDQYKTAITICKEKVDKTK